MSSNAQGAMAQQPENSKFKSGLLDDGKSFSLESLVVESSPAHFAEDDDESPMSEDVSFSNDHARMVGQSIHIKEDFVENALKKSSRRLYLGLGFIAVASASLVNLISSMLTFNGIDLGVSFALFGSGYFFGLWNLASRVDGGLSETRDAINMMEDFIGRISLKSFKKAKKDRGKKMIVHYRDRQEIDGVAATVVYDETAREYVVTLSSIDAVNIQTDHENALRDLVKG